MKTLNMITAIKRYNDIMAVIGLEHNTIGTRYSECTDEWTLRDMVAECDYVLSTYYELGHCNCDLRYSEDVNDRKMWKSETGRLERFIKTYEPFIKDLKCVTGHCSRYDN